MIFYFTGTGNSLYVAQELEENPLSIPQIMKKGEPMRFEADRIGIVTPVYGHEVPAMVKDFLHQAHFQTEYFYMILTYGNRHGGAAELASQLCEECGITASYINVMLMVDNWLPLFDMDEQRKLDKNIEGQLQIIRQDLAQRKVWLSPVTKQDAGTRPELASHIENPDQYDIVFLGFPNWNASLPMPVISFLEQEDLSGKTIIPFSVHGGSGFSDNLQTIQQLQPQAEVLTEGLTISRNNVSDARSAVEEWVQSLDLSSLH